MAQDVTIKTGENMAQIMIDGHEIKEVVSYHLYEEVDKLPRMVLEFEITGQIEALIK